MPPLACLNGELMPADEARVPITDRGFLFGDSVYEVYRIYGGRLWLETAHSDRLRRSLRAMHYRGVDLDRLADRLARTIAAGAIEEGTAYVQITRGSAPRAHAFPGPDVPPTELIVVRPYDDATTEALRRSGCAVVTHPEWRWRRCDVKSTNLLANVLANEAAHRAGAFEAIFVDEAGRVSEATHSSLLWVRAGRLEATAEGPGILPGTSRHEVERLAAAEGIAFAPAEIVLNDLHNADEVLLTGTTIEVLPVISIDGRPVGDGRPGPITRRLHAAFRDAVDRWRGAVPA